KLKFVRHLFQFALYGCLAGTPRPSILMKAFRTLILSLIVLTGASLAQAGIRPSFHLETCSWRATDIVVVTEGEQIDGVFRILEIVKGDLKAGEMIKIIRIRDMWSTQPTMKIE